MRNKLRLIFIDFDKTITESDLIDNMRNELKGGFKKLWDEYENKWKEGKISNIECLVSQLKLFQDSCKVKKLGKNLECRDSLNELFSLANEDNKIFIISDNFQFQILETLHEYKNQIVTFQEDKKCISISDIASLIQNNSSKNIFLLSNILTKDHRFIFPYRELSINIMRDLKNPICKQGLKRLIESLYEKNRKIETIFIGCNDTEADLELAEDCDKVFICKESSLIKKIKNNDLICFIDFSEVIEYIK